MRKKEKHKTLRIPLKMLEVDVKIAPVVRWLNSYPSVHTLFSCQGSAKDKHFDPNVLFACDKYFDLYRIVNFFPHSSKTRVEIQPSTDIRNLVYRLTFADQADLETFVERLPEKYH
jgi:hypothetical protein